MLASKYERNKSLKTKYIERDHPDHKLLLSAIQKAGNYVQGRFQRSQKVWSKGKSHPVCEADIETNVILRDILTGERPSYGWLSEESEDNMERLDRNRIWVVDPIDGTNSYLKGIPEFAVSVGLIENGEALAGAIFNPAQGEMFDATKGGGAFLNNKQISVTTKSTFSNLQILASRSEFNESRWPERFNPDNVRTMSSIAYKLASIAAGRFDATASAWPKADWDICAGCLLVSEAGGTITSIGGKTMTFNKKQPVHPTCLASNGLMHRELIDRLREWAEK